MAITWVLCNYNMYCKRALKYLEKRLAELNVPVMVLSDNNPSLEAFKPAPSDSVVLIYNDENVYDEAYKPQIEMIKRAGITPYLLPTNKNEFNYMNMRNPAKTGSSEAFVILGASVQIPAMKTMPNQVLIEKVNIIVKNIVNNSATTHDTQHASPQSFQAGYSSGEAKAEPEADDLKEPRQTSHDVFISHSSEDKPIADAVCSLLEQHKIRCWIAPRDVTPGLPYASCITEAIKSCKILVVIFSSHSNTSFNVTRELELAIKHNVVVIPFRVENINPSNEMEYYLSSRHWLDALTPPLEGHISKLSHTILRFLNHI